MEIHLWDLFRTPSLDRTKEYIFYRLDYCSFVTIHIYSILELPPLARGSYNLEQTS
jgi:hypothetical protein